MSKTSNGIQARMYADHHVHASARELYEYLNDQGLVSWTNECLIDQDVIDYGHVMPTIDDDDETMAQKVKQWREDYPGEDVQDIQHVWIVSVWLYEKLEAIGAPVCTVLGQRFWGRTEKTDGLHLDSRLFEVARQIEADLMDAKVAARNAQ